MSKVSIISEINKYKDDAQGKIFDSLGIFFAFSSQQYNESKKEGIEYVNGGAGMVIPKENVKVYIKQMSDLLNEVSKRFEEEVSLKDYIAYELYNHEAFYTYRMSDTLEAVSLYFPDCTEEEVIEVFREELKEQRTNFKHI